VKERGLGMQNSVGKSWDQKRYPRKCWPVNRNGRANWLEECLLGRSGSLSTLPWSVIGWGVLREPWPELKGYRGYWKHYSYKLLKRIPCTGSWREIMSRDAVMTNVITLNCEAGLLFKWCGLIQLSFCICTCHMHGFDQPQIKNIFKNYICIEHLQTFFLVIFPLNNAIGWLFTYHLHCIRYYR
jgi:hypothetical protein